MTLERQAGIPTLERWNEKQLCKKIVLPKSEFGKQGSEQFPLFPFFKGEEKKILRIGE